MRSSVGILSLRQWTATPTPAAARLHKHMQNIFIDLSLLFISDNNLISQNHQHHWYSLPAVSLTLGNGWSGTGTPRNWQSGSHPSRTWNTNNLSGDTSHLTWSTQSVKNLGCKYDWDEMSSSPASHLTAVSSPDSNTPISPRGYLGPRYVGATPVNTGATVWSDPLNLISIRSGSAIKLVMKVLMGLMELLTDWYHFTGSRTLSRILALGYILARSFQYRDMG